MKISGIGVAVPLLLGPKVVEAAGEDVAVHGPGKVPVELTVNGKKLSAQLEPRVTLLDALRDNFNLTGAKRVCDRGVCGACTVLDGRQTCLRLLPCWQLMRKGRRSPPSKVWPKAMRSLR